MGTAAAAVSLRLVDDADGGDPRGRRYTPEEKARAYLVWRIAGGRSLAKTAKLTGVGEGALAAWHRTEGWARRAEREDELAAYAARGSILATVVDELQKSIATVTGIRDDPTASARDRLAASVWLAGVAGVVPIKDPTTIPKPAHDNTPSLPAGELPEDPAERVAYLRSLMRKR
jgi:transposase-like protein